MKATAIRHWRGLFAAAALVAAGGLSPAPANAAEDAFVCMEESQEKCDRENRNMALFIEGPNRTRVLALEGREIPRELVQKMG